MLEIDTKLYEEFISKLTINGVIGSCIIETTPQGMSSCVMSSDQVILARVSVSPKAFKTFSDGLKIALGKTENESDVDILTKALKTYNGNLKVDIQNNLLVLEAGDHTGFIEMTADEFVDEHCPKFPDLQWDMSVEETKKNVYKLLKKQLGVN